jgi:hypothetical protein
MCQLTVTPDQADAERAQALAHNLQTVAGDVAMARTLALSPSVASRLDSLGHLLDEAVMLALRIMRLETTIAFTPVAHLRDHDHS